MFTRGAKLAVLGISVTTLSLGGVAGAESAKVPDTKETEVTKQGMALEGGMVESTRLSSQERKSTRPHQDSPRSVEGVLRQLLRQTGEQGKSQGGQGVPDGKSQSQRAESTNTVSRSNMTKERMKARISQLQAKERAGLFERPPASGRGNNAGPETREQELEIAQDDIVADPVEPIPYARYVQIYKASAKRYGFAKDWYVLAAVGKVESNHGQNMGPSGAGAMGPMQFLPSTWKEYGVDGNGDGAANILDPEDAVPAAAAYLKAGGAPHDWYAALYTYNRAGSYVRKVLSVAEGYRRLAKDAGVEPYDQDQSKGQYARAKNVSERQAPYSSEVQCATFTYRHVPQTPRERPTQPHDPLLLRKRTIQRAEIYGS